MSRLGFGAGDGNDRDQDDKNKRRAEGTHIPIEPTGSSTHEWEIRESGRKRLRTKNWRLKTTDRSAQPMGGVNGVSPSHLAQIRPCFDYVHDATSRFLAAYEDAVENVRRRLLRAAAALDAARVPYAVVGGNAVAAWVSRADEAAVRNTRDVDVLLRREDLPAATAALAAAGFVHRRVASLGQAGGMDVFLDGAEGKVRDAVHVVFAAERTRPDQPEPMLPSRKARTAAISGSSRSRRWCA